MRDFEISGLWKLGGDRGGGLWKVVEGLKCMLARKGMQDPEEW
jgi:hypothetical protein